MDLTREPVRRRRMRFALVAALCVAAIAAPAALAKGRISIALGDTTPRVGQPFTVDLRTGWVVPANDWLRLIAVAPGKSWYDVVGTVTGDSSLAHADIPHDGFEIKLRRVGPRRWRAVVRLPRAAGGLSSQTAHTSGSWFRRRAPGCRGFRCIAKGASLRVPPVSNRPIFDEWVASSGAVLGIVLREAAHPRSKTLYALQVTNPLRTGISEPRLTRPTDFCRAV